MSEDLINAYAVTCLNLSCISGKINHLNFKLSVSTFASRNARCIWQFVINLSNRQTSVNLILCNSNRGKLHCKFISWASLILAAAKKRKGEVTTEITNPVEYTTGIPLSRTECQIPPRETGIIPFYPQKLLLLHFLFHFRQHYLQRQEYTFSCALSIPE